MATNTLAGVLVNTDWVAQHATDAGIVMFIRAVPSLKKGDTIVNIGVVSTTTK